MSLIVICLVTFCILEQVGNSRAGRLTNEQFKIYVLVDRLIDVLPYNYEDPAWKKILESPPPGKVILADKDIEAYNWEDQEIALDSSSSKRLVGLKLKEKSFIAYLGERPLFGGSFIERGSARAIDYPVIYIDRRGSHVVFQLWPRHGMFASYRELKNAAIKRRIELADVRAHFSTLGKLR